MDIGILGGGIAGLSVALALHRTGHRPRVYERGAAPATMGAGVTLWPNAGFVLDALGLLPDVAAAGGGRGRCAATTTRAMPWATSTSPRSTD